MQLWIIEQASFDLIQKDSLAARTLFTDWGASIDHRSRLVKEISTVCQQEHCVQTGMQIWIIDLASLASNKKSLTAITLFSDWDATMDHRPRLLNYFAGTQLRIRIKICSSGPCKIVMGKIVIIAHPSHQGPRP